jgi:pimeloyl-ACP methyl ester carboxylesterase
VETRDRADVLITMSSPRPDPHVLLDAVEVVRTLPERYLGGPAGFEATYELILGDVGRSWAIHATADTLRVRPGGARRSDVVIGTDAETWLAMHRAELSGVQAFARRTLYARGDLDLALGFEGLFRRPDGRAPLTQMRDVHVGRTRISTLTMGAGPDVLLLHGLGATKTSFFDTLAALSREYRVHAIDFPGFGSSSKPATASYTPAFFADSVLGLMDELEIDRAHLVGNSMGGRVAIEIGLRQPERVGAVALLCPAVAFVKRELWPLVRIARPELGLLPHHFSRRTVASQFWAMIADRDAVDPSVGDIAVDEFQRIYGSPLARYAFLAAARNIYLDTPYGRHGFYERLSELSAPALFLWGTHDPLIPVGFKRHVARSLPMAEQIVLQGCGHVPQIERPEQVNGLLRRFFARADALGGAAARTTAVSA